MLKQVIIPPSDLNTIEFDDLGNPYEGAVIPSLTSNKLRQMSEAAQINLEIDQPPPQNFLEVVQDGTVFPLTTAGNFSMVIGKAKSRKTFLMASLMGAALKNYEPLDFFKSCLPMDQRKVMYFDTEQGQYHVQKAARRVLALAGNKNTSNLKAFSLRKYSPNERLSIIEYILYNTPGVGFVVIDGIRDLIASINDEEQSTMLVSKLLKWTEELNIHIVCVLHQNKNDTNARGHLGTEAQNKAELVLSVTKDKDISVVQAEYCREKEFNPFAFEIDEAGLPVVVEHWSQKPKSSSSKINLESISTSTHTEILKGVFANIAEPKYKELSIQLKAEGFKVGLKLSDIKVRDLIQEYKDQGLISTVGREGTRYCHYVYNPPC